MSHTILTKRNRELRCLCTGAISAGMMWFHSDHKVNKKIACHASVCDLVSHICQDYKLYFLCFFFFFI